MAERESGGDTLRGIRQSDGSRITLRLAGIYAPEKAQSFGRYAGSRLAAIFVSAEARKTDRYGRTVACIRCEGVDPSRILLEEGLAWHYLKYSKEQTLSERDAEASAESAAMGCVATW